MNFQVGQEVTYANGEKGFVISVTAKSPNSVITECQRGHIHFHSRDGAGIVPDRDIIPPLKEGDPVWVSDDGVAWYARIYTKKNNGDYLTHNSNITIDYSAAWKFCKKYIVGEKP